MKNNQEIKNLINQLISNITLEGSYKNNNCWYVNTTLDLRTLVKKHLIFNPNYDITPYGT